MSAVVARANKKKSTATAGTQTTGSPTSFLPARGGDTKSCCTTCYQQPALRPAGSLTQSQTKHSGLWAATRARSAPHAAAL